MKRTYISPCNWGNDHWSMLAYIGTLVADMRGFQIGLDARMRQNPKHFSMMQKYDPPRRPGPKIPIGVVMVMENPDYASRLRDDTKAPGLHDDWDCVRDMIRADLFTTRVFRPGTTMHLSEKGREWLVALQKHKASGGTFATFSPDTQ